MYDQNVLEDRGKTKTKEHKESSVESSPIFQLFAITARGGNQVKMSQKGQSKIYQLKTFCTLKNKYWLQEKPVMTM